MKPSSDAPTMVGPVLQAGSLTNEIIAALRSSNPELNVLDRGGYLRVSSPRRCVLSREIMESLTGREFRLPGDLETVMSSFKGLFSVNEDEAVWEAP